MVSLSLFDNKKTKGTSPELVLEHAHAKAEKLIEHALKKTSSKNR
jgi:hypothetical protein